MIAYAAYTISDPHKLPAKSDQKKRKAEDNDDDSQSQASKKKKKTAKKDDPDPSGAEDKKSDDEEEEGYQWWKDNQINDGVEKWTQLEHNGPLFPPPYEPHGVRMKYNGQSLCWLCFSIAV
jgi:DNA topoisomerase-1